MPIFSGSKYNKIRFNLDSSDWHGRPSETLWAIPLSLGESEGLFEIANTPFFVRGISFCDVVEAKLSHEDYDRGIYEFKSIKKSGGHSTYMIICDGIGEPKLWHELQKIGCTYESKTMSISNRQKTLLAVDVPPETDIYSVYKILERGESDGVWLFQEGHFGHSATKATD